MVRRILLILGLLLIALPLGSVIYSRIRANSQASDAIQQTVPLSDQREAKAIVASGRLKANQVVSLSFLVSGQVADITVAEGDLVTLGQPLMRLDSREQYLAFEQANLSYGLSLLRYQDLLVVDQDAVRIAEANVASAKSAYSAVAGAVSPQDIATAELQYQQALQAWEDAKVARSVADPGVLGDEGIALLDAQIGEASFNAETARLRLEELRTANYGDLGAASANINQAEAALEQVKAGASTYEIEQEKVAVQQAVGLLNLAELNYHRTLLTAPFEGIVANVNAEHGQRIAAGVPVLQLVDIEPLILSAEVNEADLAQVSVGMEVEITVDALAGVTFAGVVTAIAPKSRDSAGVNVYDIDIQFSTTDTRLRPGMSADAQFIISK